MNPLSQKQISRRIAKCKEKILEQTLKIKELQEECTHTGVHFKYRGGGGGYDRDDSYWINYKCPHCDKYWRTDQTYEARFLIERLDGVEDMSL